MSDYSSNSHKRPSFADIKAELLRRLPALVRELAPGGKIQSGYYKPKNPVRADNKAGSFWVHMSGKMAGAWSDAASGDKGDVIGLVVYCKGLADNKAAYRWCLSWLGWDNGVDRKVLETARKQSQATAKRMDRQEQEARRKNAGRAQAMFFNALPSLNTPVEVYLKSRGIDLLRLADEKRFPNAVKFLADQKHIDDEGKETVWPCMAAALCNAYGVVISVHRTWLNRDGNGKAPVTPSKKMWPTYKGAVIRLSKGKGKRSPEAAGREGKSAPVVICEGIEDGLAIAQALPDLRVWAAGTLGNMANVPNLKCISKFIIAADNDVVGSPAALQMEKVVHALRQYKKPVSVVRSLAGKDFNDQLMVDGSKKENEDDNI